MSMKLRGTNIEVPAPNDAGVPDRNRAIAVLHGAVTAEPPLYACITSDALITSLTGRRLRREDARDVLAQAYRGSIDVVRIIFDSLEPYWEEGRSTDANGFVHETARWTKWVEERPFRTVAEHASFIARETERFRAYRPGSQEAEWCAHVEDVRASLGPDVLLMGRFQGGTAPGSYFRDGLDHFAYLWAERPRLVRDWLDARHGHTLARIAALADPARAPVEFIDADVAYRNGLLVSPEYLREVEWFRRVAEIADAFHACGVKVIFHSDGDLRAILPELARTGIDGLNPIETAAGMTLRNVRSLVGDRLLLVGGIPNDVLIRSTPAEVRECVRALKHEMRGTPWWAGTSTEEFDESMPPANVRVVLEETGHDC